jgi:hypothetical protein
LKGKDNHVVDHLSKMEIIPNDPIPIDDYFSNKQLASIKFESSWFANYTNFIVAKVIPPNYTYQQGKKFLNDLH